LLFMDWWSRGDLKLILMVLKTYNIFLGNPFRVTYYVTNS